MKKRFLRILAMVLVLCTVLSVPAMAANPISLTVSIEDDEGDPFIYKFSRTTRYLTEDTNLLYEVVKIINDMYHPHDRQTDLWKFDSLAMKLIMDEGLAAYATGSDQKWYDYVEEYYEEVKPVAGDRTLKAILRDKNSLVGDLWPDVEHKIKFKNTVETDKKFGVTYTVTVIRNGGNAPGGDNKPGKPGKPGIEEDKILPVEVVRLGSAAKLNKEEHFAYIKGYPDGNVRPNAYITREEVTTIFYRLLTEESRNAYYKADCRYTDVETDRWSNAAIATMANAGIIKGYPDASFRPKANMTRAEFAAVAARFENVFRFNGNLFYDIEGHWAANEINSAAARGWVKGSNGLFRPDDYITRAEAVTLINRVLERAPEYERDLLSNMKTFHDNMDTNKWYYLAIQEAANGHDYFRKPDGIYETWTDLIKHKIAG